MKNLVLLSLFLLVTFSCKQPAKSNDDLESKNFNLEMPRQRAIDSKNKNHRKILLSKAQSEAFFPEYIGSHKRFNVFVYLVEPMAAASYGSFDNSYNYSVYDAIKDNLIIKNFEMSYNGKHNASEGTEYIVKERDGYKTIAFLQPEIKRYDIRFVYNNRFRIVLEGPEHPDVLWSYIDFQKFNSLK